MSPFSFAVAAFVATSCIAVSASSSPSPAALDLAGEWRLHLDPQDRGLAERWFARPLAHPATIALPGSLSAAGVGDAITVETKWTGGIFDKSWFTAPEAAPYRQPGHIKVPFWLQPETRYVGAAWYQREIEIPAAWAGRRVVLTLERPHWKTAAWIDERPLGARDSLSVAHSYELGVDLRPGVHTLTLRIDNTFDPDIGENSHSVSDHTQGNWNGVVGRLALAATAPAWIDDLQISPDARDRTVRIAGLVAGKSLPRFIRISSGSTAAEFPLAADGSFDGTLRFPADAPLWDEFTPHLHRLVATLENGERREFAFGFRTVAARGRQLTLNDRPLFLRGALDCAAFPRTGHPPTDVASWKNEFAVIRAHGLNHVRFHSWCPPEAAFTAADELGVYLQIEVASWPNQSTTLGDGKPVDAWLDAETDRILRAYGNHPSFLALCACNEPGGDAATAWLTNWVARHKARDPRRLYTAGAGWPETPANDYHVRSEPRIQQWGAGLKSRLNALPPETRTDYRAFIAAHAAPVVSHEIGQWCAYPNFAEMPKYTGYLKPRNFEIFRDSLAAHGLLAQAHDFLIASGKLQALCYKEDIESALRTSEMGGFQLLGLADFPGQGTALVGILDAFWEEKGYITPAEFRRFCNSTVPLARLDRRVFTTADTLTADVEVAHFGAAPLEHAHASWRLLADDGRVAARGEFAPRTLAIGAANSLGRIELPLATLPSPARYKLVVSLDGTAFENDWDLWLYPATPPAPTAPHIRVTRALDAATLAALEAGESVLLTLPPTRVRPDPKRGPIALGFSSIFWNTAWTHGQPPHTLGILCDPKNPALAAFPTDACSNWQWWYVVTHAAAMILDDLPAELRPTIQVVDDWFTNRKLALAFEARVGPGRVLVTSIDLDGDDLDPVRRQLRISLLAYAGSPRFAPTTEVTPAQLRALLTE